MKLQVFIAIHALMLTADRAESQSWLLKPANPASTDSYCAKTRTNATAHTNRINENAVAVPLLAIAPSINLYW
jgi:hypothetical protein